MSCAAFTIPPQTRFRRHEHPAVHVCIVLRGGFVEREGRGWRDVGAGTVRVSGPARHDIDFGGSGARCLVLEPESDALGDVQTPRFMGPDRTFAQLVARFETMPGENGVDRNLNLDGWTMELLAQIRRRLEGRRTAPPSWLDHVRERLHDEHGRVSVSALAEEAGIHRVHLARAFHDHMGSCVSDYARRLRLAHAQRLIADTRLPLSAVAVAAGFADQSHLTRSMQSALGITPGAARRARLHGFKTGRVGAR